MERSDVGLIGLGVMGSGLCLNIESKGYTVAAYNREPEMAHAFFEGRAAGKQIVPAVTLKDLSMKIKRPRKIILMVSAGQAVDQVIEELVPFLEKGDILIDGGNSHFEDTSRRQQFLFQQGIEYVGCGISGGEAGALHGPALMPGGDSRAWPQIKPLMNSIAARAEGGTPCCSWIGPQGSGHFVKMVHNGIEYGDIQLICEAYAILRDLLGMSPPEMAELFFSWDRGPLQSYLISITAQILTVRDPDGDGYLVDQILDEAGQKGTGKWAVHAALEAGVALPLIAESVFARFLSCERKHQTAPVRRPPIKWSGNHREQLIQQLEGALYAAKIISYAQGFQLMKRQSDLARWELKLGEIALSWRSGCIIRSAFLSHISEAYRRNPQLGNLMEDHYFFTCLLQQSTALREVLCAAIKAGVPVPAFSSALAYYDAFYCERLPANLLQAQRDYFGAHTVRRTDQPAGQSYHYDWAALAAREGER